MRYPTPCKTGQDLKVEQVSPQGSDLEHSGCTERLGIWVQQTDDDLSDPPVGVRL